MHILTISILISDFRRIISESIPWLLANNNKEEADEIMHKAGKMNGIELPQYIFVTAPKEMLLCREDDIHSVEIKSEEPKKKKTMHTAWEKFKDLGSENKDKYKAALTDIVISPVLRKYIIILIYTW